MQSGIGTAGDTLYDDNALETALDLTFGLINFEIYGDNTTTKVTGNYALICRKIQMELIAMQILLSRQFNENNLADAGAIQGFWTIMPALTREHMRLLHKIGGAIRGHVQLRNINDGGKVL